MGSDDTASADASRSAAQPDPATSKPPARGDSSSPMARRSTSAPVSSVVLARSASAAAASARSTRSSSTQRPWERISGRASVASSAISAALSSTSSNTADQVTWASWWAPTTESSAAMVSRRSEGVGFFFDSAGTRTSNPAAAARGPVELMSSQASSWLSTTWPRRASPGRFSTGMMRSSRVSSSARCRLGRPSTNATSRGTSWPSALGPETDRNHALSPSGGSSWTTRRESVGVVSGEDQRSRRLATSVPGRAGTSNADPSNRVSTVSAIDTASSGAGGGAGRLSLPAASVAMALTIAPRTERVSGRASVRSSAVTGPGMAAANESSSVDPSSAGAQRTDSSIEGFDESFC